MEDADEMEIDFGDGAQKEKEAAEAAEKKITREMPVRMEFPHPRFNALLAVQDDVLYIYGGTFEKGDREFTFDDLYAVDLGKLDGCKEVFSRPVEDWIVSTPAAFAWWRTDPRLANKPQVSDDEDEDDDDEDDYEDDEEDEEGDVEMADEEPSKEQKFTPSARKKKQAADEVSNADSASTAPSTVPAEEEEETESAAATTVDDGLPHPRVSPSF